MFVSLLTDVTTCIAKPPATDNSTTLCYVVYLLSHSITAIFYTCHHFSNTSKKLVRNNKTMNTGTVQSWSHVSKPGSSKAWQGNTSSPANPADRTLTAQSTVSMLEDPGDGYYSGLAKSLHKYRTFPRLLMKVKISGLAWY